MNKKMFSLCRLRLFQLSLFSIFVLAGCTNDPENVEPVATNSHIEVTEDEPQTAMMLAEDQDGDTLEFSIKNYPNKGELTILDKATGRFEYKPNENIDGEDQFTFRVSDGKSESSAVVTIQINAESDAPQAVDDTYTLNEGASKGANVLDNDNDPDGDTITLNTTAVQEPSNGTLSLSADGRFTYIHDGSETTSDSFIYEIIDVTGRVAQATVTLIINPSNDFPVAFDDGGVAYTVTRGGRLNNAALSLIVNDTDIDGTVVSTQIVIMPSQGTLALNSNGTFNYKNNGNSALTDSFTYRAIDDQGGASLNAAVVTIIVNAPPVAENDSFSLVLGLNISGNVMSNDQDAENDPLVISLLTSPSYSSGAFSLSANGDFTYNYDASKNSSNAGFDSFSYKITDTYGGISEATVTILLNKPPIADDDNVSTNKGVSGDFNVLEGDSDPDGTIDSSTIKIISPPSGGIATVLNGQVRYTPSATFLGQDSFDYTVKDNSGVESNVARVTITVNHNNPVAEANCTFVAKQTETQQVGILKASDVDAVDANAMTFKLFDGNGNEIITGQWLSTIYGQVRITNEATGAFEFKLANMTQGLGKRDEFEFQVSVSGEEPSNMATQSFLIEPRIMPLGNSITDGISMGVNGSPTESLPLIPARNGYRKSLYSSLSNSNYKIDFVGSKSSGNGVDNHHEGNPGWATDEIRDSVISFLNTNAADIILLHIGTNDVNDGVDTPAEIRNEVRGILDNINSWANGENVTVLVAKIIDFNPTNNNVATLNSLVTTMVNTGNWPNLTVSMVDQYSALTNSSDWGDELHPTEQGYNKIANRWMSALTPVLDTMCYE